MPLTELGLKDLAVSADSVKAKDFHDGHIYLAKLGAKLKGFHSVSFCRGCLHSEKILQSN